MTTSKPQGDGPTVELLAARIGEELVGQGLRDADIVLTSNRIRLASKQVRGDRTTVRVSRRLLSLGGRVVEPLVGFLLGDDQWRGVLSELIDELEPLPDRPRTVVLRPKGDVYDLHSLMQEQASALSGIGQDVDITWGPRRPRRRQRGAKLGSYDPRGPLIRVNPLLDDAHVPAWYVGFVIFHEMLHHVFGVDNRDTAGRRVLHPPAFRARERLHPHYAASMDFESDELLRLLALG